ncbi:MAG: aminoglycoside phosphotransferase family enzyme/predicted kinase [Desulforhopalus sp.]|jgi:aminoglycoside phosphotransferase family enzyme/predicted kinase
MSTNNVQSSSLIQGLMKPESFNPPVQHPILLETHISWVIVAEPYAYKIKKSLNLGFLDFSTLKKRLHFCKEELRLNQRLAPHIYLSVIPITGTVQEPQWEGAGNPIEYAIKMIAFPQETQLDRLLSTGLLTPQIIDALAGHIAHFHTYTDRAAKDTDYGETEVIRQPVEENFRQIRNHVESFPTLQSLDKLEEWTKSTLDSLQHSFSARKATGFIRECHGDLHLRNIAWVDDKPLLFDCIEFSPLLRWIDVISDVAFLVMDLEDRKQPELAKRLLNKYLEFTGDYSALHILRYYLTYRALVRAKIDVIRASQDGISSNEKLEAEEDFNEYLKLALHYIEPTKPQIIITRGLSASGKSTVSQALLEHIGAIRIRSDVERKRLHGLQPPQTENLEIDRGIYSQEATERTYTKLTELAAQIIDAGYPVIVDGVFTHSQQRQVFRGLAAKRNVPFTVLECTATIETLRKRITERKDGVSDANLAVLESQFAKWKPLQNHELDNTLTIDTQNPVDIKSLVKQIQKRG